MQLDFHKFLAEHPIKLPLPRLCPQKQRQHQLHERLLQRPQFHQRTHQGSRVQLLTQGLLAINRGYNQ